MPSTLVIDSSVFLSAFLEKEVYHKDSICFFEDLKKVQYKIIVPSLVIFEVLNNFYRHGGNKEQEERIFRNLQNSSAFSLIPLDSNFLEKIYLPLHHHFDLKTADSIFATIAFFYEAVLISWDKKLISQTKKHIQALTPKEFLKHS